MKENRRFDGFAGFKPLLFETETLGLIKVDAGLGRTDMVSRDARFGFVGIILDDRKSRSGVSGIKGCFLDGWFGGSGRVAIGSGGRVSIGMDCELRSSRVRSGGGI